MAVANGATIIKSVTFTSGDIGTDGVDESTPVWTLDGRWLVDVDYVAPNVNHGDFDNGPSRKLIAISRDGKTVRELPCAGCAEIAAIGDGKILVGIDRRFDHLPSEASPNAGDDVPLAIVDLNSKMPPVIMHSQLPEFPPGNPYGPDDTLETYNYRFISWSPDEVVALQYTFLDDVTPENLVLIDSDGTTKALGTTHSSVPIVTAADTAGSVDGKRSFVFDGGWDESVPNESTGHVAVLDPTTGNLNYPDTSAMFPSNAMPSSAVAAEASDLWWGADKNLYGLFSVVGGSSGNGRPAVESVPNSLWRLDGMRWTKVSDQQLDGNDILKLRMFSDGSRALTLSGGSSASGGDSTLYFQPEGGDATQVSDDVTALLAPGT